MVYSKEWLKNAIHEGYFKSYDYSEFSVHKLIEKREKPIEGTPDSYIQLYERCWNYDPNQHPELEKIQESLLDLSGKENFDTTLEISNSDIPLSTNSNHDYEKILEQLFKFIDNLSMEYFLNAGAGMWELQPQSRDVRAGSWTSYTNFK
ncbi:kinase-like protein [Gigaspora margarita]|uniref:Kinase-like protein n=1 Tax=Gigaspora margarita TaxID=4874 RepID=A0A8H3XHA0_GIGMA|nr:kinase-like protein [Gigaspora margarita]